MGAELHATQDSFGSAQAVAYPERSQCFAQPGLVPNSTPHKICSALTKLRAIQSARNALDSLDGCRTPRHTRFVRLCPSCGLSRALAMLCTAWIGAEFHATQDLFGSDQAAGYPECSQCFRQPGWVPNSTPHKIRSALPKLWLIQSARNALHSLDWCRIPRHTRF